MAFFEVPIIGKQAAPQVARRSAPGYQIMEAMVPEDVGDDFDKSLAAAVVHKLQETYKGHFWQAYADIRQGIVGIQIPLFMPPTLFEVLHTDALSGDPGMKSVVRAGGAILERWYIPRSSFERGLAETLRARDNHRLMGDYFGRSKRRQQNSP